jgi:hypothetical protein
MWPVDEVDDGEEPPVPDFIATEAHRRPLGVIRSRGECVWAWDAHWKRYLVCRMDKPRLAPTTSTDAPAVSPASALTRRHASISDRSRSPGCWRRGSRHHLETTGKLLILLEGFLTIFSKCALKSLYNQAGFDSAIRRFDPSRPSQKSPTIAISYGKKFFASARHNRSTTRGQKSDGSIVATTIERNKKRWCVWALDQSNSRHHTAPRSARGFTSGHCSM